MKRLDRWRTRLSAERGAMLGYPGAMLLEGEIRSLRKIAAEDSDEARTIHGMAEDVEPYVSQPQALKGLNYLYSVTHTPRGTLRHSQLSRGFSGNACDIIRAAYARREDAQFLRGCFRLYTLEDIGRGRSQFFPVYQLTCDGRSFRYFAGSWQSTGGSYER